MIRTIVSILFAAVVAAPAPASAHCDTTGGPVIGDARTALQRGDVRLVLHWVSPEDEAAVRDVFTHTLAVRRLGPEARELADRFFFETLVRVHRAGEGAPYTGLRSGAPEPIIAATDRALEKGSPAEVEAMLIAAVREGLAHRFAAAKQARAFGPGDVSRGRAFVAAYVPLTHWVEEVYQAAGGGAHGEPAAHPPEGGPLAH